MASFRFAKELRLSVEFDNDKKIASPHSIADNYKLSVAKQNGNKPGIALTPSTVASTTGGVRDAKYKLWDEALGILRKSLKPSELEELQFLFNGPEKEGGKPLYSEIYGNLADVLTAAARKRDECEAQKYCYTRETRGGDTEKVYLRDKVGNLLQNIVLYANVADPMMQAVSSGQAFVPLGIIWGSLRTILTMTTSDIETYGKIMAAMDEVVLIMTRAREYETLYTPPDHGLESMTQSRKLGADGIDDIPPSYEEVTLSRGRHRLLDGLPGLYAAILLFAVKVGQYFGTSATKRFFKSIAKPFLVEFQPLLDAILSKEALLRSEASPILAEDSAKSLMGHETTHSHLVSLVQQVSDLQAMLDQEVLKNKEREDALQLEQQRLQREMARNVRVWLKPIETDHERERNINNHKVGTCAWILADPTYQSWLSEPKSSLLRVSGLPGTGKSVLSAFLVSRIANDPVVPMITEEGHKSIVFHFFFKDGSADATTFNDLARNIVYQLLDHSPPQTSLAESDNIFLRLADRLRISDGGTHAKKTVEVWKLLQSMLELLKDNVTIIIIIDALDECSDREETKLLENLTMVQAWNLKCMVKILCTSRPKPDIEAILATTPKISMSAAQVSEDIRMYVEAKVQDYARLKRFSDQIVEPVVRMSAGMFRYATLMLEDLSKPSKLKLHDRLATLPSGIYELYELILAKLPEDSLDFRQSLFRWLVLSHRELKLSELGILYATEGMVEFDIEDVMLTETADEVLEACGSLIEVDESQRVRFSHLSVKEFLLLDPSKKIKSKDEAVLSCLVNRRKAELVACTTIFTMLNSERFREKYFIEVNDTNRGAYESGGWAAKPIGEDDSEESEEEEEDQEEDQEEDEWEDQEEDQEEGEEEGKEDGLQDQGQVETESAIKRSVAGVNNDEMRAVIRVDLVADEEDLAPYSKANERPTQEDNEACSTHAGQTLTALYTDFTGSIIDDETVQQYQLEHSPNPLVYPVTNWMSHLSVFENQYLPTLLCDAEKDDELKGSLDQLITLVDEFLVTDSPHLKAWQRVFSKATVDFALRNFNLSISTNCYSSSLHLAASYNLPYTAERLLEKGADPTRLDSFGSSPIHWACCFNAPKVVAALLKAGCPVNHRNTKWGWSPLHYTVQGENKQLDIFRLVLNAGGNVHARDNYGNTPIHEAAWQGLSVSGIATLLDLAGPEALRTLNNEGETPFHMACKNGHFDTVKLLLERGSDVNCQDQLLEIPLHEACNAGNLQVVEYLLSNKADPHMKDIDGDTPLHAAVYANHPNIVSILLLYGAHVDTANNSGHTPFLYASRHGYIEIIKILHSHGAATHLTDGECRTALHHAAAKGHLPTINFLLKECNLLPLLNERDVNGATPLIRAARNGHKNGVAGLLEAGAAIDIQTKGEQMTALMGAAWCGRPWRAGLEPMQNENISKYSKDGYVECARLLLACGADPEVPDICGQTAIAWVKAMGLEGEICCRK